MRDVPPQHLQFILDSAAQLLEAGHTNTLPETACAFFRKALAGTIKIVHNSVFEFRHGRQPKLLFCESTGYDNDLTLYLRGMYLLDPYFDVFRRV